MTFNSHIGLKGKSHDFDFMIMVKTSHFYNSSHGDPNGECSMAKLNDEGDDPKIEWSKESCDDTSTKGVLCSRRHFWEEIKGRKLLFLRIFKNTIY